MKKINSKSFYKIWVGIVLFASIIIPFALVNKVNAEGEKVTAINITKDSVTLKASGLKAGTSYNLEIKAPATKDGTKPVAAYSRNATIEADYTGTAIYNFTTLAPTGRSYVATLYDMPASIPQKPQKLTSYPFVTLDTSIDLPEGIRTDNKGTPCSISTLNAEECKIISPLDSSFSNLVEHDAVDEAIRLEALTDGLGTTSKVYKLLAPLGKIETIDTSNIGNYFNLMVQLIIGLCGALAVVVIIIRAIQYMGEESIFGKKEAKGKMGQAILGLLIALGSYAILNTIDPALLGGRGLSIPGIQIDVETTPLSSNDTLTEGKTTSSCKEGIITIETINGKIPVCQDDRLASNVKYMFTAASLAKPKSLKLFGFGYRSTEKQEALRSQNCGGAENINKKGVVCTPPTALPGTSLHEHGKAIDFTCNGASIQSKDNECYLWLKENAKTYGFYNLRSEPWHWSTTGH